MSRFTRSAAIFAAFALLVGGLVASAPAPAQAANPYLPEWEHVPDGEPYIFDDPDQPGKKRLYIYGSHDTNMTSYCGKDLVLWSAPVEDPTDWRYDGKIFEYLAPGAVTPDTFYAPDIAARVEIQPDGTSKTAYYLYPQDTTPGRGSLVAKSYSPKGPFEVLNWSDSTKTKTVGELGFDPDVFIDDDGKAYAYWGFQTSYAAELQDNMYQIKPQTKITNMIASSNDESQVWRYFEGSSLRKVEDKYVFVYARKTLPGEGGLSATNASLGYAYGDTPLGPWTYGGTLVDARANETGETGQPITTMAGNNTHGSITQINGEWFLFYHRAVSGAYARQGMAEKVDVSVTDDGRVVIKQVEVTSEGLEVDGLDPAAKTSAGIASWVTGGAQIPRIDNPGYPQPSAQTAPVTNTVNGAIVGYKYFDFDDDPTAGSTTELTVSGVPQGVDGTIDIMLDRPWANSANNGRKIGTIAVLARDPKTPTDYTARVPALDDVDGKHAVYFVFRTSSGKSVVQLDSFRFGETAAGAVRTPDSMVLVGAGTTDGRSTLGLGSTATLTATVRPTDAADPSVAWSSSNPKVATVGADGTVTGVGNGVATITATANGAPGVSASLTYTIGGEAIANGTFDVIEEPWTTTRAKSDSTAVRNIGFATRFGDSGRSYNPKSRTYDGDSARYPFAADAIGAGRTYSLSAQLLYKKSENVASAENAPFTLVLSDANGVSVNVVGTVARDTWTRVQGTAVVPAGFDSASARLDVVTGSPSAPLTRTTVPSFFLDQVSVTSGAFSSDASLASLTVSGQQVDVAAAASAGATVAVPAPDTVTAADVVAAATDPLANARVTVNARTVTVVVDAQNGTRSTYRVALVPSQDPVLALTTTSVQVKCTGSTAAIIVTVRNGSTATVTAEISSTTGRKTVIAAPGKAATAAFTVRSSQVPAGDVSLALTSSANSATESRTLPYAAAQCR